MYSTEKLAVQRKNMTVRVSDYPFFWNVQ